MDISNIKSKKDARDSMKEYYEPVEVAMPKEKVSKEGFFDRQRKASAARQQKQLKKMQKQNEYLQKKYGAKLETQRLKTEISELKQRKRASSPLGKIPAGLSKVFQKPDRAIRAREQTVVSQQKAVRAERQISRQQMEYDREYHRKFGVRNEGDGEMPYYEKEHMRPLPKKCAPVIGITNGERVPKKKSLKEELF
jgi:hypothetical protein